MPIRICTTLTKLQNCDWHWERKRDLPFAGLQAIHTKIVVQNRKNIYTTVQIQQLLPVVLPSMETARKP